MNTSGTRITRSGTCWLASLLVLTQLPHILHLPVWVSLVGISLIMGKAVFAETFTRFFPSWTLIMLAILSAAAVKFQYGYFLGRDPSVAFLFILVALKFAETRQRRDVTLLICLSGFLLFTQYFYSQTLLAAIVSLPAVFAMGGNLYVLRDHSHNAGTKPVLWLIAKLLVQGLPIAAVLFFLFPRLSSPLWSLPSDTTSRSGLSEYMSPGSISDLSLSAEVAFRVEFEGDFPDKKDLYWRGPVLSSFDGRKWSATNTPYSVAPRLSGTVLTDYTVTLEPHNNSWLFALDNAASLPVNTAHASVPAEPIGRLNNLGQLIANSPVRDSLRYRQSSTLQNHLDDDAPKLLENSYVTASNQRSQIFAANLRRQYADDKQLIASILQWFNQEQFYYTLQPSLLGDNPVDEFLFETREGFCEHYASAFVLLLRASGIASRVVTGYQGGEVNEDYLIVRQSDAHAWAEAWVDGKWQRYDPTAAVAPSRISAGIASALGADEPLPLLARLDGGWLKNMGLGWDAINHRWRKHVVNFGLDDQTEIFRTLGMTKVEPWQIVTMATAIAFLWAGFILRIQLPARTGKNQVQRLWSLYLSRLNKAGLSVDNTMGPLDISQHASQAWPEKAEYFRTLTQIFIQLQFSRQGQETETRKDLTRMLKQKLKHFPSTQLLISSTSPNTNHQRSL